MHMSFVHSRTGHLSGVGSVRRTCVRSPSGLGTGLRGWPVRFAGVKCKFSKDDSEGSDIFDLEREEVNSGLKWERVRDFLTERGGLRSVTKPNAEKLVFDEGYTVIDVRTRKGFDQGPKIYGSINVPLFKEPDEVKDFKNMARKVAFSLLPSIEGTYYNENFINDVERAVGDKAKPLIIACGRGGIWHKSRYFPKGIASRSLLASAILIKAGFKEVAHVHGGLGMGPGQAPGNPSGERNHLLEIFYGRELPGTYISEPLMMVSYTICFGILASLIIPRLPEQLAKMGLL